MAKDAGKPPHELTGMESEAVAAFTAAKTTSGPRLMLSVVKGIEPRDQIEAMLAAQMAAVHMRP